MVEIRYPASLQPGAIIGVTAPSSGISPELTTRLEICIERVRSTGFQVQLGQLLVSQEVASATAVARAHELIEMLSDERLAAIVPPWGGELLVNILPQLDFEQLAQQTPKWLVGYSDISTLLAPYTMLTGIATLHGSNFMETAYEATTGHLHWLEAVTRTRGSKFSQESAERYQIHFADFKEEPDVKEWRATEPVQWKLLGQERSAEAACTITGRLIGGCLETLSILCGSKYGDIATFVETYAPEGILPYFEVCEETAVAACRMFHQLKMAGWFQHAKGILIGRTAAPNFRDFTQRDALLDAFADLNIPVIYDLDIGHLPPQLILINGAVATIKIGSGRNTIEQHLI